MRAESAVQVSLSAAYLSQLAHLSNPRRVRANLTERVPSPYNRLQGCTTVVQPSCRNTGDGSDRWIANPVAAGRSGKADG